jgi:hypothetical protein
MYKALTDFIDLQDNYRKYRAGDTFPRKGYDPGEERIAELAGTNNKRGCAVIAKVAEKAADKPVEEPKEEKVEIPVESVEEPQKRRRGRKKNA